MSLTGRKAIRQRIKQDYQVLKGHGGYDAVGLIWHISGGMAWKFDNEEYYWPKDKEIEKRILIVASNRGINLGNKGGRDLWAMPTEELLWRLENREQVNGHNQNAA